MERCGNDLKVGNGSLGRMAAGAIRGLRAETRKPSAGAEQATRSHRPECRTRRAKGARARAKTIKEGGGHVKAGVERGERAAGGGAGQRRGADVAHGNIGVDAQHLAFEAGARGAVYRFIQNLKLKSQAL